MWSSRVAAMGLFGRFGMKGGCTGWEMGVVRKFRKIGHGDTKAFIECNELVWNELV